MDTILLNYKHKNTDTNKKTLKQEVYEKYNVAIPENYTNPFNYLENKLKMELHNSNYEIITKTTTQKCDKPIGSKDSYVIFGKDNSFDLFILSGIIFDYYSSNEQPFKVYKETSFDLSKPIHIEHTEDYENNTLKYNLKGQEKIIYFILVENQYDLYDTLNILATHNINYNFGAFNHFPAKTLSQ